jgi:hypothetical protein
MANLNEKIQEVMTPKTPSPFVGATWDYRTQQWYSPTMQQEMNATVRAEFEKAIYEGRATTGLKSYQDFFTSYGQEKYPAEFAQQIAERQSTKGPDIGKMLIPVLGFVGGVTAGELLFAPSTVLEAPSSLAVPSATFDAAELSAYDAAMAEGAAQGVGTVPMVTGAETAVTSTGVLSSIGSGIGGIFKVLGGSVLDAAKKTAGSLVDKEIKSIFAGSGSGPGVSNTIQSGSGISMLPFILIGITLLGAFILTRKRKGGNNG